MRAAAPLGEMFVTATGSRDVITAEHMAVMRDGAMLANAGHCDGEIDVRALDGLAASVGREVRPHADEYVLAGGRRLLLLAEGRVVNLVAAEGHPAAVMDVAFGLQALALAWLAAAPGPLAGRVHEVPGSIDAEVARLKLASLGTQIDTPTVEQRAYLASWQQGS
jgi:adenosylhomocysteinase